MTKHRRIAITLYLLIYIISFTYADFIIENVFAYLFYIINFISLILLMIVLMNYLDEDDDDLFG